MYLSIKQHTKAFERMGIELSKIDKDIIQLSTSDLEDSSEESKNDQIEIKTEIL